MKKQHATTEKFYVNYMGSVSRPCKWCDSLERVNADPAIKGSQSINLRCACGEVFQLSLDAVLN